MPLPWGFDKYCVTSDNYGPTNQEEVEMAMGKKYFTRSKYNHQKIAQPKLFVKQSTPNETFVQKSNPHATTLSHHPP